MIARHVTRVIPLLLLAFAPNRGQAQLELSGIPWGTPADSAKAQIQRAGYVLRGRDQLGDWVFRGPDRAELVASFDSAGLVAAGLAWSGDPGALPDRFQRLADSLAAEFGPPAPSMSDVDAPTAAWHKEGVTVLLFLSPRADGQDSTLSLRYEAPGWEPEYLRRNEALLAVVQSDSFDVDPHAGWQVVHGDEAGTVRVDSAAFTVLGDRLYGARLLYEGPVRRLDNGMMYDGVLAEVELDCGRGRSRARRTVFLYALLTVAIQAAPHDAPWDEPPPGSSDALAAACSVLDRQPK